MSEVKATEEVVAKLRKWQDDSMAGQTLKTAADLIEQSPPLAVSDALAECARAYAGDTGLHHGHPLWSAIEAYQNARARR